MKDKFSIFSPPASKNYTFQSQINFQKGPSKFVPYDPLNKPKELFKPSPHQSLSSSNLDNPRRLPSEQLNLRQTLSFKPSSFDYLTEDDEKDKMPKTSSYLRQTISNHNAKHKGDKNFSESFAAYNSHSTTNIHSKEDYHNLSYSRKTSHLPQNKSYTHIQKPKPENSIEELRKKWKDGGFQNALVESKKEKLQNQLKQLKKITQTLQGTQESIKKEVFENGNFYSKTAQSKETHSPNVFRKKSNAQEQYNECYTPKLPKSSYQERFKKLGSPTSTNNSDSRSPPNKFIQVVDQKKKSSKLSIQDFAIGKTLGQGKFGVVMIARHRKTGSLFALKKIPKDMIKSHMMIDQLALEIRLQSCLNHKNILGIYGFFDDSTHLFIVLEYMENGTLYSELKKSKILPQKEAAVIIKQVALAVQYLHDQDIAHRDIKPQNIVISNKVYKLCDFGWATLCNQRRKTYCGTFDYAAPQILEGKQYDMSVDLWCLGILTYELLTGKAPFYHLSRKETMRKIINCETETVTYTQKMSPQVIDFIERLIRKNPDERMKASEALKHKFLAGIEV